LEHLFEGFGLYKGNSLYEAHGLRDGAPQRQSPQRAIKGRLEGRPRVSYWKWF